MAHTARMGEGKLVQFLLVNVKDIGHLRDVDINGRITVTKVLYTDIILSDKLSSRFA